MACLALVEECGFVFFELAAGLAGSWHVVTAFVVLRAGVGPAWVECVVVIMVVAVWCHGWFGVRPLCLCFPPALTIELSKLDMNNGPTIFWLNHFTNIRQYSISTVTVK